MNVKNKLKWREFNEYCDRIYSKFMHNCRCNSIVKYNFCSNKLYRVSLYYLREMSRMWT